MSRTPARSLDDTEQAGLERFFAGFADLVLEVET